jgi:FkbM family methyltransferase
MDAFGALQRTLERLPIRGKGRIANLILEITKRDELECHPLSTVTVFLKRSQRIERLMWAGAYERDLVTLFKRYLKRGMTVVDVGANVGYFSVIAAGLVGETGSVHAFEALPECFNRLKRNLAAFPSSHAYSCAVGKSAGEAAFYFNAREMGWGSLLADQALSQTIEVRTTSLDEWSQQNSLHALHFLKLDAEGGEHRILSGAERVLRQFRPVIVTELNSVCLGRDRHTPDDVLSMLGSMEYKTLPFNDGVLAIPQESRQLLSELQANAKNIVFWPG